MEIIKNFLMLNLLPFAIAFAFVAILGPMFIKWLLKLKFGQQIRGEGPKWHQKKSGTPTMGGIMFILGIVAAFVAITVIHYIKTTLPSGMKFTYLLYGAKVLLLSLGFGAIGFVDDYIKVVKKRNLGLTSKQKFLLQLLVAVIYVIVSYAMGDIDNSVVILFTDISISLPLWLYIPFVVFVIVGVVNAVNLTDGLDGLASSVTVIVALTFSVAAFFMGGMESVSNVAIAVVGGLLGFLIYNKYPAKVFMGDTGSLFLGAMVAFLAIELDAVLYLLLIGFVYFAETLSVILQTAYFKYTKKRFGEGRRIFKMSPLHHHFEMCGWKEVKIVRVFSFVTFVLCLVSIFGIILN